MATEQDRGKARKVIEGGLKLRERLSPLPHQRLEVFVRFTGRVFFLSSFVGCCEFFIRAVEQHLT